MTATRTYPNGWAKLVGELMRANDWNQVEAAERIDVNRNTIRRWLSGESANASTTSIQLVADAAGIQFEVAARAVAGAQQTVKDDRAVQMVMADTTLDPDARKEIIDMIERKRDEAEASILRDVEFALAQHRRAAS